MANRKVFISPAFSRKAKKLKAGDKLEMDQAVSRILDNPEIGEEKVGDLAGVFVYKFRMRNLLVLLSYIFDDSEITLITFGSHENFYRDLKKYLKD